jgi:hypothetical protein
VIAGLFAAMGRSRLARRGFRVALAVAAVVLLLLAWRRSGERIGRLLEQSETQERSSEICREMLEATARRPRGRDDLSKRLRDGGF